MTAVVEAPAHSTHDAVNVRGAMTGSPAAWFLAECPDLVGRVLAVVRESTCKACSTARTNSCTRQQFLEGLNLRISQFAAEFAKNFGNCLGSGERVPEILPRSQGYVYLADTEGFADVLRATLEVQRAMGAGTAPMTADEIKAACPFYDVDDIALGSISAVDERHWDRPTSSIGFAGALANKTTRRSRTRLPQ